MKTPVLLIAGFLGAGKTTFIQQLVQEIPQNKRLMVIENDFGQVSFDTAVLSNGDVDVTELRQGCICCSLRGDFTTALTNALDRNGIDLIIIEPSGVGLLSDIINACNDPSLINRIDLQQIITIVDVQRCPLYLKNFGPFYKDQIQNAHMLVLSHQGDASEDCLTLTKKLLTEQNNQATLISESWLELNLWSLIKDIHAEANTAINNDTSHDHDHTTSHNHDHTRSHDHDHTTTHHPLATHNHEHSHPFETTTLSVTTPQPLSFYTSRLTKATSNNSLIRAKGIVPVLTESGTINYYALQVVSGAYELTPIHTVGHEITFIISTKEAQSNMAELVNLFNV